MYVLDTVDACYYCAFIFAVTGSHFVFLKNCEKINYKTVVPKVFIISNT